MGSSYPPPPSGRAKNNFGYVGVDFFFFCAPLSHIWTSLPFFKICPRGRDTIPCPRREVFACRSAAIMHLYASYPFRTNDSSPLLYLPAETLCRSSVHPFATLQTSLIPEADISSCPQKATQTSTSVCRRCSFPIRGTNPAFNILCFS